MYETCVQYDNVALECSSIAKSLQCVLTRSDVFTGPRNFQFLVVFDQKLCKNIKKVLNLIGFMLFIIALHFVFLFELVRYGNANTHSFSNPQYNQQKSAQYLISWKGFGI